jgi:hypothetical protein
MNKVLPILLLIIVLPGCTTTLYGQQSSGGGQTSTTTGAAVRGSAQSGNARVSGSFGAPPPAQATGGQITLSRGGSAALVIGLAMVGTGEALQRWLRSGGRAEIREPLSPDGISHTCSCYGWQPELTQNPPAQ